MTDRERDKARDKARDKRESAAPRRGPRLDTPLDPRRAPLWRSAGETDRFGTFAENFARFMGTAQFLLYMTAFVVFWIAWNVVVPRSLQFDEYPFIFLTLMLSLQASYAAPLILLAQNRQELRDRVVNEQDRQANVRAHADMEYLAREVASLRLAVGEVATRDFLRSELRNLLDELADDERDYDRDRDQDREQGRERGREQGRGQGTVHSEVHDQLAARAAGTDDTRADDTGADDAGS